MYYSHIQLVSALNVQRLVGGLHLASKAHLGHIWGTREGQPAELNRQRVSPNTQTHAGQCVCRLQSGNMSAVQG